MKDREGLSVLSTAIEGPKETGHNLNPDAAMGSGLRQEGEAAVKAQEESSLMVPVMAGLLSPMQWRATGFVLDSDFQSHATGEGLRWKDLHVQAADLVQPRKYQL